MSQPAPALDRQPEFLVTIPQRKAPEAVRPRHEAAGRQLLGLWRRHFGEPQTSPDADYELFFEQAARLKAALDAFGTEGTWLWAARPGNAEAVNAATGDRRPLAELRHLPAYGSQPGNPLHTAAANSQERLADRYHLTEAFRRHAGRRFNVGGYAIGGTNDAVSLISGMANDGVRQFFIKGFPAKTGIWQLSVDGTESPADLEMALIRADDSYAMLHLEGRPQGMLIQERIRMTHEYRIFIVDGVPVTGAGCIEEHTPLDGKGARFDTRFRPVRGSNGTLVDEPMLARWLRVYAEAAAADFSAEGLHTYVMDVALGPDGTPLVVELNGLLNSGLYATDPVLVTRALSQSPKWF